AGLSSAGGMTVANADCRCCSAATVSTQLGSLRTDKTGVPASMVAELAGSERADTAGAPTDIAETAAPKETATRTSRIDQQGRWKRVSGPGASGRT
ncbi:MAG TPA: hypothetical protein VLX59_16765, partial [Acidimicrobiales bacterium]|nr:hypothetical protein [Acidimicrobiales bacterium]